MTARELHHSKSDCLDSPKHRSGRMRKWSLREDTGGQKQREENKKHVPGPQAGAVTPLRGGFQLNPRLSPTVHVSCRSVTFLPTSGEHGTLLCL